jgi:hypothetical protein
MHSATVPESVADRMVEILFDGVTSTYRKRVLYPGCRGDGLVAAVVRYFEDSVHDPPEGVALGPDPDVLARLDGRFDALDVAAGDFLSPDRTLAEFEFVLGHPPTVQWDDLSTEKQREYANTFARVSPDTTRIDTAVLFVERSLHHLTPDGRGVFLVPSESTTSDAAAPFREYLSPTIADVEAVGPEEVAAADPHMITAVTSPESTGFEAAPTAARPSPESVEAQLLTSADTDATVEDIATPHESLTVYETSRDASFVYLDLYYHDYDATLVYDDPAARSGLRGYVSRANMHVDGDEAIVAHASPLDESTCLEPTAGIGVVIDALGSDGDRFRFVGTPDEPSGLVTRFDLNSLPVYRYLYGLLARFEIRLRDVVRTHVPDWQSTTDVYVSTANVGALAPDDLAGASLGELLQILAEAGERDSVPCAVSAFDASLDDLRTLRNAVAHYNPLVHTMSNDAETEWTARRFRDRHDLLQAVIE